MLNFGVCSIFLHVERSINEIHKSRALIQYKYFIKSMYLFIIHIYDLHIFSIKLVKSFKGTVARDCQPLVFFMNRLHMGL
jgi:hypothetical protein